MLETTHMNRRNGVSKYLIRAFENLIEYPLQASIKDVTDLLRPQENIAGYNPPPTPHELFRYIFHLIDRLRLRLFWLDVFSQQNKNRLSSGSKVSSISAFPGKASP